MILKRKDRAPEVAEITLKRTVVVEVAEGVLIERASNVVVERAELEIALIAAPLLERQFQVDRVLVALFIDLFEDSLEIAKREIGRGLETEKSRRRHERRQKRRKAGVVRWRQPQ